MANSVDELLVIIDATTENLRRELKRAESEVNKTSGAIAKAQAKMAAGWKRADKWVQGHSTQIKLLGAAAVAGVGVAVKALVGYTDNYKNLQGQVKLVTEGQDQLNAVWNEALGISNRTGSSLDTTVKLYARMARATEDLGLQQSQLLNFTETINQAFAVSGATSEETSNAIIQLTQGMAAGALRGEELNSVLEQAPRLASLIADELGTTVGKLKEYGKEGAITSEVLVRAFENGADQINKEFSALPVTIERALNRIKNTMADAFGKADMAPMMEALEEFERLITNPVVINDLTIMAAGIVKLGAAAIETAAAFTYLFRVMKEGNDGTLIDLQNKLEKAERRAAKTRSITGRKEAEKEVARLTKLYDEELKRLQSKIKLQESVNKTTEEGTAATEESTEATSESVSALEDQAEARNKAADKIKNTVKALEAEAQALGRSAEMQAGFNALQQAGLDLADEGATAIFRKASANERLRQGLGDLEQAQKDMDEAAAEAARQQEEAAQRTEKAWADARATLSDFFFEFAKDGEDAFDTLTKGFESMLQKMIADAAANQIFLGFGAAASAVGANAIGSAATKAGGGGSFDPITAAATVAATFVASKVFGEDNDGQNRGAATFDLGAGSIVGEGIGKSFEAGNVSAAQKLAEGLQQFADLIGGSSFEGRIIKGGDKGIELGSPYREGFGSAEEFFQFSFDEVIRGAEHLDDALKDMLISFEGTAEEITLFSSAFIQMSDSVKTNPVEMALADTLEAMDAASGGLVGAYSKQAEEVNRLIDAYDGSSGATVDLNNALQSSRQLAYEASTAILQMSQAIGELLGDQAQYFREAIMSQEELQRAREQERSSILDALRGASNPQEVEQLVQAFAEVNRKLFDSLADEQQQIRIDEFTGLTEEVDTIAQTILGQSIDDLKTSQDDINRRMVEEITGVAGAMQDAVDDMGGHVDRFGGYIQDLVSRGILVQVQPITSEVL
jgi:tape measure domain-containing protein